MPSVAARLPELVEHANHALAGEGEVDDDRRRFPRHLVDNRQRTKSSAVAQRVADEIHAPQFVGARWTCEGVAGGVRSIPRAVSRRVLSTGELKLGVSLACTIGTFEFLGDEVRLGVPFISNWRNIDTLRRH